MTIALAILLYLGFALLVGRFCSMNSRWEHAVSGLLDESPIATGAGATLPAAPPVDRAPRVSRETARAGSPKAAWAPAHARGEVEAEQPVEVLC